MAPGAITSGRRVGSVEELEQAADYAVTPGAIWLVLPTAISVDPFAKPHNQHNGRIRIPIPPSEGAWSFAEDPDGAVTLGPSIAVGSPVYWHGYLEHGTWREV